MRRSPRRVTLDIFVVHVVANMPEADDMTVGGAVAFTTRVAVYDLTPVDSVD